MQASGSKVPGKPASGSVDRMLASGSADHMLASGSADDIVTRAPPDRLLLRIVLLPKGINEWVVRRLSGQRQGKRFGINADVWNGVKPTSCDGVHVAVCTYAGNEVNDVCRTSLSELLGSNAIIKPCSFLDGSADRLVSLCDVFYMGAAPRGSLSI